MMPEAIGAISAAIPTETTAATAVTKPAGGFGDWFTNELAAVDTRIAAADQGVRQLAAGEAVSLHDVMIKLEEARMSFQLLAQVRNRVLEAYQEVMRTQV